ncbi:tRNA adenosine(34) deaminase TadA [Variovorax sp. PCZ-1]|uniref:tRNA adenosine(34) deaminase TadA n=1 Tax=Variovorax sp. PCZ-1 TaxID=2835533 RepID=UPI001BCDAE85|nr:tRNA adenosine(34) deaminase TadA [Variovorax sp. PCZ-1]MBS7806961.1 tRNA adenosine(34) deaminase TadA [Variovorax sp. PCZ-1]
MDTLSDAQFLQLALSEAQHAGNSGEVPVGAVVVKDGRVIATGRNSPIGSHDPTAHAEINALRAAARELGNYRLDGCDLYVTLEPCAMCAGAILHSRIRRLVYAAPEPKTGAAGSVLNVFDTPLNHQTQVQIATELGASCADSMRASGQLLQDFFSKKRLELQQANRLNHPLRQDAMRTPDHCFENLPGYDFAPNYLSDLPALNGLRMHYLDEGAQDAKTTYLCLHGNPAWSYLYRKMIPIFSASGARVIAPDMIGFGKSDKPKKDSFHTFTWHRQCLLEFIERLDLHNIVLVVQDWGGILGLTLPMHAPQRYKGLLVMNTTLTCGDTPLTDGFKAWREMCAKKPDFDIAKLFSRGNPQMSEAECAAYMAPFPDAGHRAATRAFPPMVPEFENSDGAAISRAAREFWRTDWEAPSLMAIGMQDPVLGESTMRDLRSNINKCPEPMLIAEGGHFVQEHGEPIARSAIDLLS